MNKNSLQVLENIYAAQRLILMTGVDIIRTFLTERCGSRSDGRSQEDQIDKQFIIHAFIYSFIHLRIHSFIDLFICLRIHSFTH